MLNYNGFNLVEITKNTWLFEVVGGETFVGSLLEVTVFAIQRHGFKIENVISAIEEIISKNHNAAHFGMWGTFLYSFNKKFGIERLAS